LLRNTICVRLIATALVLLISCATPGPPQPPSLDLAKPPNDLRASRTGAIVTLTWTEPTETTDRARVRRDWGVRVCRIIEHALTTPVEARVPQTLQNCDGGESSSGAWGRPIRRPDNVAEVCSSQKEGTSSWYLFEPERAGGKQTAVYCEGLRGQYEEDNPAGAAKYAVEILNAHERGAGYSNVERVPLAPTPDSPSDLHAEAGKRGILISWTPAAPPGTANLALAGYRLQRDASASPSKVQDNRSRRLASENPAGSELLLIAADSPSFGHYLDSSFEWGKPYRYRVAAVVRVQSAAGTQLAQVQGAWSNWVEITPADVFPPSAPSGVQAVYTEAGGQRYIDLTWLPNQENDIAGYNVYRRIGTGAAVRINRELVKAPAFRDADVSTGQAYFYAVSAVDLRGNESQKSPEASESVPK
jgi:hypothetical protein